MEKKQVERTNYKFNRYYRKNRWASLWHQIHEVLALNPVSVLEIGPGLGAFKALLGLCDISVETVDIDAGLHPDHVASATKLPFGDGSYDCVCAFQMLEHLPYEKALVAIHEMIRVSKRYIVISLPDARQVWLWRLYLPRRGRIYFHIPIPQFHWKEHTFDGEHYWEINKRGYSLKKVIRDFFQERGEVLNTYEVPENPYHRFLVFKKYERIKGE